MPQEELSGRERVCGAILRHNTILMVQHRNEERTYWTLPGGGEEAGETSTEAVIREVQEETGLTATVVRHLYSEPYAHGICHCYLLTVPDTEEATLGYDPEEEDMPGEERLLRHVAWMPLELMQEDGQVVEVLGHCQARRNCNSSLPPLQSRARKYLSARD